jgi:DNA mismatch repair protein MutS
VISEGNLIKEGYNKELDELKAMQEDGNQVLMDYLEEEKRASGIAS